MSQSTDDLKRLADLGLSAIPGDLPDIIQWAEGNVQLPSSGMSKHFNAGIGPWLVEPIRRAVDSVTRIITFKKPVQTGGSVAGEVILLYWLMHGRGFCQYNWSNDKRAKERWSSRIKALLKACKALTALYDIESMTQEGQFGAVFFRMQGAFVSSNLDSDTVPLQINEEVHDWEPGHLMKARNRSTAVWNFKSVDISNASLKGDQFDKAFDDGTQQHWEVLCPGCHQFHLMRTRWEDKRPDLGGLRYDAEGARLGHYEYNYNLIRPTIRYQMPCGYTVNNEDLVTRRALSGSGRYSDGDNKGAELTHRSFTYQAVAVDFIDWMSLIKAKHDALRARALGDPEPWRRYVTEKECVSYDVNDIPSAIVVTTSKGIKKNREGLPRPRLRLFSLDRQQGKLAAGEFPHWWLVIRDVIWDKEKGRIRSRLVYEGKVETDEQVIGILKEHSCQMWQGVADSGDDTTHVYLFCLEHGINAIKGGREEYYVHENGARRIFSPERPLHAMLGAPPKYPYVSVNVGGKEVMMPDPREPMFFLYSKHGIRERHHWMQTETIYEVPEDVSDDYTKHNQAEERQETVNPSDGMRVTKWVQVKDRNDLFVDECYIALQVDMAGSIIQAQAAQQPPQQEQPK